MKKNYLLGCFTVALFYIITSCDNNSENEILEINQAQDIEAIDKADALEVDELEADGLTEGSIEQKTYSFDGNFTTTLTPEEIAEISCGESISMPLLAGRRDVVVGNVTVSNDTENLYVTYTTEGDWLIKSAHLFVGEKEDMPKYRSGYPKLWRFPYYAYPGYHNSVVKSYTFAIPLSSVSMNSSTIVANAIVKKKGSYFHYKSAFGYTASNNENHSNGQHYYSGRYHCNYRNWNKYFEYRKVDCEVDERIDAYGYKDKYPVYNTCFLDNGFSNWGWSNGIGTFDHRLEFNGILIPLFVDGEGCGVNDATEIGYVKYKVSQEFLEDGEKRYVTITYVITDSNYVIDEVNLYLGIDMFPQNNDGTTTSLPEDYTYHKELDGVSSYKFDKLPWPAESDEVVNAIQHAKVSLFQI